MGQAPGKPTFFCELQFGQVRRALLRSKGHARPITAPLLGLGFYLIKGRALILAYRRMRGLGQFEAGPVRGLITLFCPAFSFALAPHPVGHSAHAAL